MSNSTRGLEGLMRGIVARFAERGMRIGIWGRNSSPYRALLQAIPRAGRIVVPLSTRYTAAELFAAAKVSQLDGLIYFDESPSGAESLQTVCEVVSIYDLSLPSEQEIEIPAAPGPEEFAAVICTSGSSGMVKAAIHTHGAIQAHARAVCRYLQVTGDDCWLACLPFFHIGGFAIPFRCAVSGAAISVCDGPDMEEIATQLDSGDITLVSLVPTMLERLLELRNGRAFHPAVRAVILGGGPIYDDLLRRCPIALPSYGMTESGSMLTSARPGSSESERFSAGVPLPGCEIRIVDDEGMVVTNGGEGEIVARGEGIFSGYWGDETSTALALREGWLHTGDVGRIDGHGCLHVTGRRDFQIKSGGEKVHAEEVVRALRELAEIREATVVALDDPQWGQVLGAMVVTAPNQTLSENSVADALRSRLAAHKLPKRIMIVDEIPLLGSGKYDLAAVKLMFQSE